MFDKEKAAAMTSEQARALTAEELSKHAEDLTSKGRSNDPIARMTVDLFYASIVAWEKVRDGQFDTTKNYVGIVTDPQTYLAIALTGAALRQKAKPDDGPNDESKAAITVAMGDIAYALQKGHTGPSHMEWAGVKIFAYPRVTYIGVGVFTKPESEPAQVFDAEKFVTLQQGFAELLALDEQYAKSEKMDALATVAGVSGQA